MSKTMNCPRCDAPTAGETLRKYGGVCPACVAAFTYEEDAPSFPGLEIQGLLGQGGMGTVYKARQTALDRTVALKVLSPHLAADPEFVARFTREAKALGQLSHPNIVAIYENGVHEGVPYLVMEFVDGASLRKLMAHGKLSPERALSIVPQICDALQYAHDRGVIHRDIKPENILVDEAGRIKIADFGLAKLATGHASHLTRSNLVMGTPNYMAPEQVERSSSVDHRADIYSLGVVFYEMLTGELPLGRFKAPSERAPVDSRLDPVVLKSLEKEPDQRWQSASKVKERVTRLKARPRPSPPRPDKPERTSMAAIFSMIALFLCMACFTTAAICVANRFETVAGVFAGVGALLAVWMFILALVALSHIRRSGSRLGGRGMAILSLSVSCGLALLTVVAIAMILFIKGDVEEAHRRQEALEKDVFAEEEARKRVIAAMMSGKLENWGVNLADVMPSAKNLPKGMTIQEQTESLSDLPRHFPRLSRMGPQLEEFRLVRLKEASVTVVGFQFKRWVLKARWEDDLEFRAQFPASRRLDCGLSIIAVVQGAAPDGGAEARAAAELLWPDLKRRFEEDARRSFVEATDLSTPSVTAEIIDRIFEKFRKEPEWTKFTAEERLYGKGEIERDHNETADEEIGNPVVDYGDLHFDLANAWPSKKDLPKGLSILEQTDALSALPHLSPKLASSRIADDLENSKYLKLTEAPVHVVGFQFKTLFARKRWVRDQRLDLIARISEQIHGGRTVILMFPWADTGEEAAARAAAELLWPVLVRKAKGAVKSAHPRNK